MTRAQAVVIDAILFMMICGMASAALLWAGGVYGNKSFEAYKYMYLNDYETSAISTLSQMSYIYETRINNRPVKVEKYWLQELGLYMKGRFRPHSKRYNLLHKNFQDLCVQAPAPMLLVVSSPTPGAVRGSCPLGGTGPCDRLYFSCGDLLNPDWVDDDGKNRSLNETCDLADSWCDHGYFVNETKYPYYSSPIQSKVCSSLRCEMVMKIYY